jgi:hypothetical protein
LRTQRPVPSGYTVGGVPTAQTPSTSNIPVEDNALIAERLAEKITE